MLRIEDGVPQRLPPKPLCNLIRSYRILQTQLANNPVDNTSKCFESGCHAATDA
jgi:hypothetical protein